MGSADATSIEGRITGIVAALLGERLASPALLATQSLSSAGLTSLDMVNLLLQIEEAFGITVQARAVNPTNFHSIRSVATLVERLLTKAA